MSIDGYMNLIGHISFKLLKNCDFYYMYFNVFSQVTDIFLLQSLVLFLGKFFCDIIMLHFRLIIKFFYCTLYHRTKKRQM